MALKPDPRVPKQFQKAYQRGWNLAKKAASQPKEKTK